MQFDHKRGIKDRNISVMLHCGLATIQKEMKKCDLVCANCHMYRSWKRIIRNKELLF